MCACVNVCVYVCLHAGTSVCMCVSAHACVNVFVCQSGLAGTDGDWITHQSGIGASFIEKGLTSD